MANDTETLKGEVIDVDGQPINTPEDDPRFKEPEKTAMDFWKRIIIPEIEGTELNNVQVIGSDLYIVGHNSTILDYQIDGTWKKIVVDAAPDLDINNICQTSMGCMIICGNGKVYASTRVTRSWTEVQLPAMAQAEPLYGNCAVGEETVVLVGADGTIIWSLDGGRNWDSVKWTLEDGTGVSLFDVIFVGGHFFIVGNGGLILMSKSTDPSDGWDVIENPYKSDLESITYNADEKLIVCAGAMNNVVHFNTTDYKVENGPMGINNKLYDLCWGAGHYVFCGASLIAVTQDNEISLGFCPYPCAEVLIGCTFFKDMFVCVGENGMIVVNKPGAPVDQDAEVWTTETVHAK